MTILITGGGSSIGTKLAYLLQACKVQVLFGSRSGRRIPPSLPSVKFDWHDPSTFDNPFHWAFEQQSLHPAATRITAVYIIGPTNTVNPAKYVAPFIDLAAEKGVKRFVYLSASGADKNNDTGGLGRIPGYLEEKGLDWVALRPTWFIDNLATEMGMDIKQKGQFETVVPTGRIPFVATEDIATAALEALTNDKTEARNVVVVGPELLTYDNLADKVSEVLGRKIIHKAVSPGERLKFYLLFASEDIAEWLIKVELEAEVGSEAVWPSLSLHDQQARNLKVFVGKLCAKDWLLKHKDLFL
ncbi:NmrA family protein [Coprinopsis marcescibilis]|uniref:NmrA family protein n=1 Tax=Coprinopsis marcescibilis TaxID=230819 RepID=A0A5C3KMG2_COPMA|nr:NmrA family protein [Coprinopsis marcescibilis]